MDSSNSFTFRQNTFAGNEAIPARISTHRAFFNGLNPIQLLVLGFLLIVILISCLLMLPISSARHTTQSFNDALFMATSGISTTGLVVVDPGSYYSKFGQIILMLDFQIGGLGYMSFYIFLAFLLKKRTTFTTKTIAKESLAGVEVGNSSHFFLIVILYTLIIELIGGIILGLFWMRQYPIPRALYLGLFHSISAFCTAGFCLFSDSMMFYQNSILINMTIIIISLLGGIGFFVLHDLLKTGRYKFTQKIRFRLSAHSRLALIVTMGLLLLGTSVLFFAGKWDSSTKLSQRFMDSTFHAISASTTDGFNTIDIGALPPACLVMIITLMFVGASPGSTGGGIKTTTLGVIFLSIITQMRGRRNANFLGRAIPLDVISKAFSIFSLFSLVLLADLMLLCVTERASFLQILFECASALGNTGLSMGITSQLSEAGKFALSITMFIGRVGPLTLGLAILGRKNHSAYKYPEESVFVG